jgi:mono/diheme cytochrome c family protein
MLILPLGAWGAGDADHGKELYERMCAGCHGVYGDGGEGYRGGFTPHPRSLADQEYMMRLPDVYLFLVIQKGGAYVGKNSLMPGWEKSLTDDEIWDIVAHIRRLQ